MCPKFTVSIPEFESIIASLVQLEDEHEKVLNEYFPEYSKERDAFMDMISDYIQQVDRTLKHVTFSEAPGNTFPFVIIGSQVEIEDIDNNEICQYRIVHPRERDITKDYISFLSPVGMAVLLKKVGDTITVNTPGGVYRYRIRRIMLNT